VSAGQTEHWVSVDVSELRTAAAAGEAMRAAAERAGARRVRLEVSEEGNSVSVTFFVDAMGEGAARALGHLVLEAVGTDAGFTSGVRVFQGSTG
jgi:hypothetical protein